MSCATLLIGQAWLRVLSPNDVAATVVGASVEGCCAAEDWANLSVVLARVCAIACALRILPMTGLVAGCSTWRSGHKFAGAEVRKSFSAWLC